MTTATKKTTKKTVKKTAKKAAVAPKAVVAPAAKLREVAAFDSKHTEIYFSLSRPADALKTMRRKQYIIVKDLRDDNVATNLWAIPVNTHSAENAVNLKAIRGALKSRAFKLVGYKF